MNNRTIVIGAGLGGLAAAIHLALQGQRVLILEKNERVGGKLDIHTGGGYTFDTGPSLLTMPWVVHDLFAAAGRSLDDELSLIPIEPVCRYRWPDGTQFDASQCLPHLMREIARLSKPDVKGFLRFLAHTARIYHMVADTFLLHPVDGFREWLSPTFLHNGPKMDAFRSMDASLARFFQSPHLRQLFNRYATYNGSSPYRSPATFNIIAYIEFTEGSWYIRGGMYELARAMLRLALDLGVEVRTREDVEEIHVSRGYVQGVRLRGGATVHASRVIVNADPRYAYRTLLPQQTHIATRLEQMEPSSSGFVLMLGINRIYPQLAHHNIFFSHDYPQEFAALFEKRVPPADPTIYVCATSLNDPTHAPPGHMNLFVLVNAPALNGRVDWHHEAIGQRNAILRKLERMGLDGLEQHIVYEQWMNPCDIEQRYNAAAGAIYGLASNNRFAAFLRPPLRARGVNNLYFVGGGTHPGGGIPLVLLSGRAVAQRIALS